MIILHLDLQPQFKYMNYFIYTSHHFSPHGRYELNKLASLPMCGFIAQLVEHRTGIAEVTGSNPVEALIFFRLLPSNCLNWKIYCDDHSSLRSTTAVQIYELFHICFTSDREIALFMYFSEPRTSGCRYQSIFYLTHPPSPFPVICRSVSYFNGAQHDRYAEFLIRRPAR